MDFWNFGRTVQRLTKIHVLDFGIFGIWKDYSEIDKNTKNGYLYFPKAPSKNFFRRPAAGVLNKPIKITLYDYPSGNPTGNFIEM